MQKDFHYDVVYVLAQIAGYSQADAFVIAYSSQYVDDACNAEDIRFKTKQVYSHICSSHETFDLRDNANEIEQHHVWIPFHFLPGNDGLPLGEGADLSFSRRIICCPDSYIARDMIIECLKDRGKNSDLYRLGITLHTYADTWAHHGFAGIVDEVNKVEKLIIKSDGTWGELGNVLERSFTRGANQYLPLGHGPAMTHPDMPFYEEWGYSYQDERGEQIRNNKEEFLLAADNLLKVLRLFKETSVIPSNVVDLFDSVKGLTDEQRQLIQQCFSDFTSHEAEDRHQAWVNRINEGFFPEVGGIPDYVACGSESWKNVALDIKEDINLNQDDVSPKAFDYSPDFITSNWKLFHDALQAHRFVVVNEVLPRYGLCVS